MLITVCKSKIHRATVTEANLDYEGSITIDSDLMKAADIIPFEKVHVVNITNGNRLETYAIEGKSGSGIICLNGAAAHKGQVEKDKAQSLSPTIVKVDKNNKSI
jgi:aspartate 1-decarboxylase